MSPNVFVRVRCLRTTLCLLIHTDLLDSQTAHCLSAMSEFKSDKKDFHFYHSSVYTAVTINQEAGKLAHADIWVAAP